MTPWESLERDPEYKAWLQSRGWRESEWNRTAPTDRAGERVEYNGGLQKTGILRELPGAVVQTVAEQSEAVKSMAKATGKFILRALTLFMLAALFTSAVAYRKPLGRLLSRGRK